MGRRAVRRENPRSYSALENGWVGPSRYELMQAKAVELRAKAEAEAFSEMGHVFMNRAKGIAIGLAVLRNTRAKAEWAAIEELFQNDGPGRGWRGQ